MATQVFDSNNDPVIIPEAVGTPDQQVADRDGNLINPSREDGNVLSIKTNTDNLDVLLSTRATESTTLSIDSTLTNQLDVLLSSRASEATLSSLDGKFSSLGQKTSAASAPVVLASDQSVIPVQGIDADGSPLTEIPLSIAATDENGDKRTLLSDTQGRLVPINRGDIDSGNSSTTPLGAGATFTGTITEVRDFSTITVSVFSDQPSATDGLVLEQSIDGVNFDSNDKYTIDANTGKVFSFSPFAQFYRLRYTNGATPQGSFRLQSILHPFNLKSSSHRVGDDISEQDDAELVISVLKARNTAGLIQDVNATTILGQNHLAVVSANILLEQAALNQTYSTSVDFNLATGGAQNSAILIRNPSGSGKALYFSRAFLDVLTKGNQVTWRLFSSPTVTATGTPTTITSTHVGGGAPASVMQIFSGPTISVNGTKSLTLSTGVDASTAPISFDLGIIVEPGNDVLLTGQPSGNNTNTAITLSWVEQ